jgi:anti-sigma factor RsiW
MMDYQEQLRLQAYLDGELSPEEAQAVANRLASDEAVSALAGELRQTKTVLAGFEKDLKLPETREFYWSKIQREIVRAESREASGSAAPSLLMRLRRLLVPAAGAALVGLAALTVLRPGSQLTGVVTSAADPGVFVYRDYAAGATLVWLSYPAEHELADNADFDIFD